MAATDGRLYAACLILARSVRIWRGKMGDASLRFLPVGLVYVAEVAIVSDSK